MTQSNTLICSLLVSAICVIVSFLATEHSWASPLLLPSSFYGVISAENIDVIVQPHVIAVHINAIQATESIVINYSGQYFYALNILLMTPAH